ncbi:metallophosphoesterase [Flavobacterium sp. MFBS3-15]|uniref:metallophosphoesterase family protein n=1 Tax=Flavobacterium sp. MFBS3-15 TaxID=2989816 RepID=UPI0022367F8F|nr:metallophosphoesterase [Flavobacterium sp. MFBS3-15]MCW4468828.1 metallophosphoesterase [Flavobacterium sp. MFBS3-15]
MRIALITDTHLGDPTTVSNNIDPKKNLELVLDDVSEKDIDMLVFAGDITETENYGWFFKRLKTFCPSYKAILGNHDNFAEVVKHFSHPSASSTELYYSHETETYKYLYMDSSSSRISDMQYAWLERESVTNKHLVIFIHHPILGLDTAMHRIYPLHGRKRINALLQQSLKPVTVFCGHYHMADSRQDGNITQHITPAVSFQVKKDSHEIEITSDHFGYRLIDLTEDGISTQLFINRVEGLIRE